MVPIKNQIVCWCACLACVVLLSMLLTAALGCGLGQPRLNKLEEEINIKGTLYRHQIDTREKQKPEKVYFLSEGLDIANKRDPSPILMQRFAGSQSPVKPASDAYYNFHYVDKETNERGVIIQVGDIRWVKRNEVQVKCGCYVTANEKSLYVYRLVYENGDWLVSLKEE